ncbi:MAG: EFR1 family ferrodoxin [Herbinix sp.]|nr:EFR1 family ferrodoxin [Herbinix sp.]
MIFYFSGTGNSKHVAEKIAYGTGERLVYISDDTIKANEVYEVKENDKLGFVFPVYWYCIPTIVERFINCLKISGYQKQYVYAVATYGLAGGNVMDRLSLILNKKQLQLNGKYGVKMVDNYVVGYNIEKEDMRRKILYDADVEIDKIISMIDHKEHIDHIKKGKIAFVTPITGYAYRKTNHIKKFYTTQACNSCGQCVRECPCNVIHIEDGKLRWEGDCTFCLNCIHGCKQAAIQYGKFTAKRERYQYTRTFQEYCCK